MIESRDAHPSIWSKLIKYVIYCLEQTTIQNNLVGVIQLLLMLLELKKTILSYCL